jgi:Glycosyl hydrolases family 2, TIM barrel domain/Glycosyl hydrolases family 2
MALLLALVLALVPATSLADGGGTDPLAGAWSLSVGTSAAKAHSVSLPHVVNATGFTGARGVASYQGAVAYFRKRFTVPATGPYVLAFGSVHHKATVWIDGRVVARHTGAYLPFAVRRTLAAGRQHTLLVRADYRDPLAMKHSGWHRSWFNFGGIQRPVTLQPAGLSEIVAPAIRTRLTAGDAALVDVSARLRNHGAARAIALTGSLGDTPLAFEPVTVPARGERTVRAQLRVARPDLWAPGDPALYDLQLAVAGEASWEGHVGLREIRRVGARILLNGKRLVLHGASIQEDAPGHGDALTPADMDRIVARLQRIHANATRAQHPLSPELLDRLDAAGILVWQGVGPVDSPGNWTERTPAMRAVARRRVRTSVAQLQTHPSILAWNLANEVGGQGHSGGQAAYIDGMARELHRTDPGHLVALDIWGPHAPRSEGPMYRHIDVLGLTNYSGWYDHTFASQATIARVIRANVAALRRAFPDRAIVVSEFGAEANASNPAWRPGGYAFQSRLLATHIRTYASIAALSGMLVWDLSDFAVAPTFNGGSIRGLVPGIRLVRGLNQKGLFSYGGRAKPAAAVVASLFAGA